MSQITYYTEEGLKKLKDELHEMKMVQRPSISNQIAEARDKGDLSENAEYDVARDNINMLSIKISNLEERIRNSVVVTKDKTSTDIVQLFSKVTILNKKTGKNISYSIVTEDEADSKQQKISVNSPLAQGLCGHKKGEVVSIQVPAGTLELEILEIEEVE
jgi:transcription elongation factor GreA